MAPDFEYFMRFEAAGKFGHTLPGLIAFDLPASLVALWLFHVYAKEPIYTWLPEGVRRRIQLGPTALPIRNIAQFAFVSLSILIGSATHILWDSFTHRSYWPYYHWQFLHRTVKVPFDGRIEYVRIIQHVSTLFGFITLLLWFWFWFHKTAPIQAESEITPLNNKRGMLAVVSLVALSVAMLRAFLGAGIPIDLGTTKEFVSEAVVTAITVFWLEIVVYGAFRARRRSASARVSGG